MGRDKAFVEVAGVRMVVAVEQALSGAGVGPVVAIGGDSERLAALGIASAADEWPGEGPLGGILTALQWSPSPRVCIVACDLARLDRATIADLLGSDSGAAVVAAASDRLEPLCAVWRCDEATRGAVAAAFATGERSVVRMLAMLDVATVDVEPARLLNVNTPNDVP